MSDPKEMEHMLVRVIEMLRMHQESVFRANLFAAAAVEALRETDVAFAEAYERHYWELKQGRVGEENSTALRIIDQLKHELRPPKATGAGTGASDD